MTITYRIVSITNNPEDYPECRDDSKEFSHLIDELEDEMDTFVVNEETGEFWPHGEFFIACDVNIKRFQPIEWFEDDPR